METADANKRRMNHQNSFVFTIIEFEGRPIRLHSHSTCDCKVRCIRKFLPMSIVADLGMSGVLDPDMRSPGGIDPGHLHEKAHSNREVTDTFGEWDNGLEEIADKDLLNAGF